MIWWILTGIVLAAALAIGIGVYNDYRDMSNDFKQK